MCPPCPPSPNNTAVLGETWTVFCRLCCGADGPTPWHCHLHPAAVDVLSCACLCSAHLPLGVQPGAWLNTGRLILLDLRGVQTPPPLFLLLHQAASFIARSPIRCCVCRSVCTLTSLCWRRMSAWPWLSWRSNSATIRTTAPAGGGTSSWGCTAAARCRWGGRPPWSEAASCCWSSPLPACTSLCSSTWATWQRTGQLTAGTWAWFWRSRWAETEPQPRGARGHRAPVPASTLSWIPLSWWWLSASSSAGPPGGGGVLTTSPSHRATSASPDAFTSASVTLAGRIGSSPRRATWPTTAWASAPSPSQLSSTAPTTPSCRPWCTHWTPRGRPSPAASPSGCPPSPSSTMTTVTTWCWGTTRTWWWMSVAADSGVDVGMCCGVPVWHTEWWME